MSYHVVNVLWENCDMYPASTSLEDCSHKVQHCLLAHVLVVSRIEWISSHELTSANKIPVCYMKDDDIQTEWNWLLLKQMIEREQY